ncbi:MAG: RnfABCDGE type electron transport complex subunit A [Treponema sp.]|jgi:electron transport complex protein RnfA|nr:RnfABCDGE type electron transport complex subunit A [Treponema sp.]
MNLFTIFIKAVLIDNIVIMSFLALCPFIGMSTDENKSIGMGLAVTFVTVLATCVTWPIYRFILEPLGLKFLQTLAFILVIAALVQLVEFYLKKCVPGLYNSMGIYLALITTNCAILYVTLNNISKEFNFIESVVYALGVALGFLLALLLLAGIRKRIRTSPIPAFLKGPPVLFVSACLLSMAFMGFSGLVK